MIRFESVLSQGTSLHLSSPLLLALKSSFLLCDVVLFEHSLRIQLREDGKKPKESKEADDQTPGDNPVGRINNLISSDLDCRQSYHRALGFTFESTDRIFSSVRYCS
jgi:hypothetical protein